MFCFFLNLFDKFSKEICFHWDLLYLGGNYRIKVRRASEHILQLNKVFTTHSYAISNNVYDVIRDNLESDINNCINKKQRPVIIDIALGRLIRNNELFCYGFYPKITWQRKSYSDLRCDVKDYSELKK